jgi:hypothetical protein
VEDALEATVIFPEDGFLRDMHGTPPEAEQQQGPIA